MSFGRWLFPIRKDEWSLFWLMLAVASFINLNFTILRSAKAALIVTSSSSGAGVLPHLQLWGVLPATFLATWGLTLLMRRLSAARVFSVVILLFLLFFATFAFWIYPHREALHSMALTSWLAEAVEPWMPGLSVMLGKWTFSLYYIAAELWKVMLLSVLFWGFLNRHVLLSDAKRWYSPLTLGSSIGAVLAGPLTSLCSSELLFNYMPLAPDAWGHALKLLAIVVTTVGLLVFVLFGRLSKWLGQREGECDRLETTAPSKAKPNLSLFSSISYLIRSPYLCCLFVMVFADYVAYSLGELVFLDRLKALYPSPVDYCSYMGQLALWAGLLTAVGGLVISPYVLQRLGWQAAAIITPIVTLVTTGAFLAVVCVDGLSGWDAALAWLFHASPLALAVTLGSLQYCFCRASKYSLFDSAKELAFIPLPEEAQVKGKLVIDGIGARFGRAFSAVINIGLLTMFPAVVSCAPVALVFVVIFSVIWIRATGRVGRELSGTAQTGPSIAAPSQAG